ncbi:MAG: vitamin B12-dependent ribonucleotide reductase [Saccharofermentanales bacterium]
MNPVKEILKRHYTKELDNNRLQTVYDLFAWKKVDVLIRDYKTGFILTDMKNLEFPSEYSQNACDIIASKYFRKSGVPNETASSGVYSVSGGENSMRMVAHRLADFWRRALVDEGLITSKKEAAVYYDEMVFCILSQMAAPNSPQWFNTGLFHTYGISGAGSGNYYFDTDRNAVAESKDLYSHTQASACYILSIEDKLLGPHSITDQYVTETRLFKGGSGTGTNFSVIRAKGEPLSGGGYSSGLMSFLKGLDRNAGAIKSGGVTRRAAKMLCLDVDHPEIMDFITWKAKEEDKVRALGKMGYDTSFEGEAYETVSGQNGNNSVRFPDDFMNKVEHLKDDPDARIMLKGRTSDNVNRYVAVAELWKTFNESIWRSADPAPQFDDTFNAWHTCPYGEDGVYNSPANRINCTNPCGEFAFLDDTSCNLLSINVLKFYDPETRTFDIAGYTHLIGLSQLTLEASIHWGQFPTEDIARRTHLFRTTGLGITNLASLLMLAGYPYDSDDARALSGALAGILTGQSYYASSLIAKVIGPFEKYSLNRESMLRVIRNHSRAAGSISTPYESLNYKPAEIDHELLVKDGFEAISDYVKKIWSTVILNGEKYGFRNAQVTAIAPTGTISLAMDCMSTSIEPFYNHVVYKKLSGGGLMTLVNPGLEQSLKYLGYPDDDIREAVDLITNKNKEITDISLIKKEHHPIFKTACSNSGKNRSDCGENNSIDPIGHVKMIAALTPLITGAISKTVNLPNNVSAEDIGDIIFRSWKAGIKGITVYRDGSKVNQPLNVSIESKS